MITTDYTGSSSLHGAPLSRYRLSHWLVDTLKNFMSDPYNIKDERLRGLLGLQDGTDPDACRALFKVDTPFTQDTRKACTTPCVMVSTGEMTYPFKPVNAGIAQTPYASGTAMTAKGFVPRQLAATVAIVTESCDGTQLLTDTLEDFLVMNAQRFPKEGLVSQLTVAGSTGPQRISTGQALNAKDLYQSTISIVAVGALNWSTDTQGPVFRGVDRVSAGD